jgi:IS30 family transposase
VSSVRCRYSATLKNLADVCCNNNNKRFTTEDIATIKDMRAKGFYISAIAQKLGRSGASIYNILRRHGPLKTPSRPTLDSNTMGTKHPSTRKLWTRAEIDRLLDLHAAGLKTDAIARELGRSVQEVRKRSNSHVPRRRQATELVITGTGGDSVAASRVHLRKPWTKEDDEKLIELVADGADYERIASILDRTVPVVQKRWKYVLRPHYVYQKSLSGPSDSSASSEQTQRQQVATGVPQLGSQSRRTFTTLHGRETRLAIKLQKQLSALTYNSHRFVRAAPWKRCGFFSLPYRPQQRFEHTKSNPVSQTKRSKSYRQFYEEEINQIIELMAREYPWHKIGEIIGRSPQRVSQHGISSLKKE